MRMDTHRTAHRASEANAMRTLSHIAAAALVVLATACGPAATSKRGMSHLAANAPPPPSGSGKIDRKVSEDAAQDFTDAVKFYQEQGKGGWNANACTAAARRFEKVADEHNKMVEALYNAGLSYQNCHMMKDAEARYQQALDIQPTHGPSLSNLGEIYFQGGNEARAKQYWEKAVEADKKIVGARNNLAWLMIRDVRDGQGQPELDEGPDPHPPALGAGGRQRQRRGLRAPGAVLHAGLGAQRVAADPGQAPARQGREVRRQVPAAVQRARAARARQKNVANALGEFEKAVELDPDFVEARMNVGNIVLGFRKYDEASEQFQEVLKRQPKNYDAMVGLGIAQRGLGRFDDAEQSYKKATDLDGSRAEAYFNLGVLYKDFRANETQDLHKAQEAYRLAIKYFSQARGKQNATSDLQADARDNISDCTKNIQSLDEAIRTQQQAPAPTPARPPPARASHREWTQNAQYREGNRVLGGLARTALT